VCAAVLSLIIGFPACGPKDDPNEVAVFDTSYGQIVMEFLPDSAPKNVANFKSLVRERFYDGTKFHRIVKVDNRIVGVQGGDPNSISGDPNTWGQGQPAQKKVMGEFSKTLRHSRGIVTMARAPSDPNSATSQFIICTGPSPTWDGQYSIFGRIIDGINIADQIAQAPTIRGGFLPADPVVVKSIRLVKRDEVRHPNQ
jgi:cyclophilin family peptidyl-prolyl cis-trans isomerase